MTQPYDTRPEYIERAKIAAKLYDEGTSFRAFHKINGLSTRDVERAFRLGFVEKRTHQEAAKLHRDQHGPTIMGEEARQKTSERMSKHNPGGRSKWFEVAGKKVQGTWERDFALFLEENQVEWIRCKPLTYVLDDKERKYTPDFYLPKYNLYVEIKGYWWGNDKKKMEAVIKQHQDKKFQIVETTDFKNILPL